MYSTATTLYPFRYSTAAILYFITFLLSILQTQDERDELYKKFVKAVHEVQQKSNFKNLLLEKKLGALADTLEKKEAQLNEVLSASNLDPTALTVVTRKLEVKIFVPLFLKFAVFGELPSLGFKLPKNSLRFIILCTVEYLKSG